VRLARVHGLLLELMPAEVLSIHTPALFRAAVERASELLRAGAVVALPTETVYGLAANAWDPDAVNRIYALKGRPASNPLIVHLHGAAMANECAGAWPPLAKELAREFWPGPLTLVVPRSARIPDSVTAGGPTVGLRWPQHPFMQAVIQACGFPLAAPSANLANRLSPTAAEHVLSQLGEVLPLVVDGGDCNVGIESTVVDVTGSVPRVLRPGMISAARLAAACGLPDLTPAASHPTASPATEALRSPGLLARHYSPRARLVVWNWTDEADLARRLAGEAQDPTRIWILCHSQVPLSGRFPNVGLIPLDPEAYARALYGELHRCDALGAEWIVVEAPPSGGEWAGIRDRLQRASVPADPPSPAGPDESHPAHRGH
jgi:L-threonylcarbamoyladenylate synthase